MDSSDAHTRKAQYPGEDTRLTSRKELWGWYTYGWAAEVFVVCGIGSFIPITLEQLARDRGVLASDHTTPCKSDLPILLSPRSYDPTNASPFYKPSPKQCVINILGHDVNTASFALYTFSFSVLVQALVIITMSGAADHGRFRKILLLIFAFTGAIATMLFLAVDSKVFYIGAILAIVGNTCFGASFVLLNSFLPLLVRYHPSLAKPAATAEESHIDDPFEDDDYGADAASESALLARHSADSSRALAKPSAFMSLQMQVATKISSHGISIGYVGAVLVQMLAVLIVKTTGGSTWSLRLVLFAIGAWWFVFTIPCMFWLRPRPGPPLQNPAQTGKARTWLAYMGHAWLSLGRTIIRARRLKDMMIFLAAWFLLSDAIATVSGTAVLYAKTELGMHPAALALINVVVMISGVIGALTWNTASKLMGLKPITTILACLFLFELIPIYALLGYIPAIRRLGYLGLQNPIEMYPVGAVYGLVIGGLSSYCRALFAELIPQGYEATFYSLYAITDKGSSVFGPAVVGLITDATGGIRPAFWFLAVLIALPFPLMYFVDVERGKKDAATMAMELEE